MGERNVLPLFSKKRRGYVYIGKSNVFKNNPFDAIKERNDLNGLQKIKSLLVLNQSDAERNHLNVQAVPILKKSVYFSLSSGKNRRVLMPLWLELLKEGKNDSSIKTEYAMEFFRKMEYEQ